MAKIPSMAPRLLRAAQRQNDFFIKYQGLCVSLGIFVTLAFLSSQLSVFGYGSLLTLLVSLISCMIACVHCLYLGIAAHAFEKPASWDLLTSVFVGCSLLLAIWLWYIVKMHTQNNIIGILISAVFVYFIFASCKQLVKNKTR